jgi:hypothetical protein
MKNIFQSTTLATAAVINNLPINNVIGIVLPTIAILRL